MEYFQSISITCDWVTTARPAATKAAHEWCQWIFLFWLYFYGLQRREKSEREKEEEEEAFNNPISLTIMLLLKEEKN